MRLVQLLAAAAAVCAASAADRPARAPVHIVPVEIYRNAVWVQVRINAGPPLWFILDSAAGGSVIARRTAERLGLQIVELGHQANATPADTPVRMAASPNINYDVGGARFTSHAGVIGMDIPDAVWGRRFEGVLGAELFSKYVVELDWDKREMALHDPGNYDYSGNGSTLPIVFAGTNPMIAGRVRIGGKTVYLNLLIDSGASSTLALSSPLVEKHGLLAAVEAKGGRLVEGESIGAGGSAPNASTRGEWLEIGPYRIPAPLTSLSKAKAGSLAKGGFDGYIGCNVLRRFRVILDYTNKRAIFEPNAHLTDPDESDGSGMRIRARGQDLREYYVHHVVSGSPASEAQIAAGDVLVSMGGVPSRDLTIEHIGAYLRGSGTSDLVFDRGGHRREVSLVKRPLL
jgi:hypothetical protein